MHTFIVYENFLKLMVIVPRMYMKYSDDIMWSLCFISEFLLPAAITKIILLDSISWSPAIFSSSVTVSWLVAVACVATQGASALEP